MSLPWQTLAAEQTRDGLLELRCRGGRDYLILIGGRILMSSSAHRSEVELARLGTWGLLARSGVRVLVSGLGMGFTLEATLKLVGKDARVDVAELNPVVAEWCRGPLGPLTANAAQDRRTTIHLLDVAQQLRNIANSPAHDHYDSVILDMYEGPQARVVHAHPIYGLDALSATRAALKPAGVLAVWCEAASRGFERNLDAAGFSFKLEKAGHGARIHMVYVAKKLASKPRAFVRPPQETQATPTPKTGPTRARRPLPGGRARGAVNPRVGKRAKSS
jgi:spermidine synthase